MYSVKSRGETKINRQGVRHRYTSKHRKRRARGFEKLLIKRMFFKTNDMVYFYQMLGFYFVFVGHWPVWI